MTWRCRRRTKPEGHHDVTTRALQARETFGLCDIPRGGIRERVVAHAVDVHRILNRFLDRLWDLVDCPRTRQDRGRAIRAVPPGHDGDGRARSRSGIRRGRMGSPERGRGPDSTHPALASRGCGGGSSPVRVACPAVDIDGTTSPSAPAAMPSGKRAIERVSRRDGRLRQNGTATPTGPSNRRSRAQVQAPSRRSFRCQSLPGSSRPVSGGR
jgi:hypothetical protein